MTEVIELIKESKKENLDKFLLEIEEFYVNLELKLKEQLNFSKKETIKNINEIYQKK